MHHNIYESFINFDFDRNELICGDYRGDYLILTGKFPSHIALQFGP